MATKKSIAIIAGAGPGTGAAIARRFAQKYPVVLLARSQQSLEPLLDEIRQLGGSALGIASDVTKTSDMELVMENVMSEHGPGISVAAAIYNVASKFTRKPFLEQSHEDFRDSLESSIAGAFNFAQATLPLLLAGQNNKQAPTLIFTGATAALKGGTGLSGFAMSKFGIRALAQSLAREFGPDGLHVSHVIIDGIIDTAKTEEYNSDVPDAKIDPVWIAESYWFLHTQPRSSFTHEMDLRPSVEKW
ncbi:hypothetical protein ACQRIT_002936 [Beauveria bassiana]